jgi:hypothetical protein
MRLAISNISQTDIKVIIEKKIVIVQGGSDISGTLSKLHSRMKKSTCLPMISR